MSYDLHITRRLPWDDRTGPAIDRREWQALIASDPELSLYTSVGAEHEGLVASYRSYEGALRWDDGEVIAKNPEITLVVKMVAIAERLGARVQGDDDEIYQSDGTPVDDAQSDSGPSTGASANLTDSFATRRDNEARPTESPSFHVGSRVRDSRGRRGSVTAIDRQAAHGLGRLTVLFDDGKELSFALVAPGVELESDSSS